MAEFRHPLGLRDFQRRGGGGTLLAREGTEGEEAEEVMTLWSMMGKTEEEK